MFSPIATAPKDGTHIQVRIPNHGSDNIVAWVQGFANTNGEKCGAWAFMLDQEPPPCWTDGVCWSSNENGEESIAPIEWKPLQHSACKDKS